MKNITSFDILAECTKFRQKLIKGCDPEPFQIFMRKLLSKEGATSIFSLSSVFPEIGKVKKDQEILINEASSGKTSELHTMPDQGEYAYEIVKTDRLSYKYIEKLLIDENAFEELTPDKDPKVYLKNILLINGVDKNLSIFRFRNFLDSLSFVPKLKNVRFCFFGGKYSVILYFALDYEAVKFYQCCEKKMANFMKIFGSNFELRFLINKENQKENSKLNFETINTRGFIEKMLKLDQILPSIKFYRESFVGIIVRNIPETYEPKEIVENLIKIKLNAELHQFALFRGQNFCLIEMDSIEAAENACLFLNQRIIGNKILKCQIHAQSNYERKSKDLKNFKSLFRSESLEIPKIKEIITNFETIGRKRKSSWTASEIGQGKEFQKNSLYYRRDGKRTDMSNSSRKKSSSYSYDSSSDGSKKKRLHQLRNDRHQQRERYEDYRNRNSHPYRNERSFDKTREYNNGNYQRNRDYPDHNRERSNQNDKKFVSRPHSNFQPNESYGGEKRERNYQDFPSRNHVNDSHINKDRKKEENYGKYENFPARYNDRNPGKSRYN